MLFAFAGELGIIWFHKYTPAQRRIEKLNNIWLEVMPIFHQVIPGMFMLVIVYISSVFSLDPDGVIHNYTEKTFV